MTDMRSIIDRVEIEALRGEFTDAAMMRDSDRLASLFTQDGAVRMPHLNVEAVGPEALRAAAQRLQGQWDFFVQNTHPGSILIEGDTASGRAYISELARLADGTSGLNYAIYHDRYRRTPGGWKFTERVYEIRYADMTPLAGSAPRTAHGLGPGQVD
jgi:ketosteroid isomerase-like protein